MKSGIQASIKKRCCSSTDDIIFGRFDQAKFILMETFDGKHIFVDGPDGNKIDCMFFPCTSKEKVIIDDTTCSLDGTARRRRSTRRKKDVLPSVNQTDGNASRDSTEVVEPQYLSKPTMIMCNPNALYYQQMVTSPNAYWLNFFLKRDINVLCWNYRGYGESSISNLETISPYKCKRDAEYVMAYLVNRLRIKGKIGVYGRSIGGLTACHLANKYNNLVKSLIVDRSFYELSQVPEGKLKGGYTARVFDLLSWKWRTRNHSNFVTTSNCYKIITCDPQDDTVELFGNLATGVASQLAKVDYETKQYRQFYDTMLHIFAYES